MSLYAANLEMPYSFLWLHLWIDDDSRARRFQTRLRGRTEGKVWNVTKGIKLVRHAVIECCSDGTGKVVEITENIFGPDNSDLSFYAVVLCLFEC